MNETEKPLQPERLERIRSLLENRHTVRVVDLSRELSVSENTIRRDLVLLEEAGVCFRTKGGAGILPSAGGGAVFSRRRSRNRGAKEVIAIEAARFVHEGSTVLLDTGTTALELALRLREMEHITVITPSLEAAQVLSDLPALTLILSGGIVQPRSRSMTGPPAESFFDSVHGDILFLAAKAVSVEGGLTDHTMSEASVKRRMIGCADRVVVLADGSKIGSTSLSRVAGLEAMDILLTDAEADPVQLAKIREMGIEVIVTQKRFSV